MTPTLYLCYLYPARLVPREAGGPRPRAETRGVLRSWRLFGSMAAPSASEVLAPLVEHLPVRHPSRMATVTPPKPRRNSSGRRLSGCFPKDLNLEENDDENERQEAAQKVEHARLEKMRSPLKETPGHKKRVEHYEKAAEAMKLVMDNVRAITLPNRLQTPTLCTATACSWTVQT